MVLTAAVVAAMAANGFAALSQKFADFGNGPAQWIMTKDEQSKWKTIKDDAEAQAFIDLFWARRDPTPGTPQNEFKDDFDQRVKYADDHFAHGRSRGAMTDRGRIVIVMSVPTGVTRTSPEPKNTIAVPEQVTSTSGNVFSTDNPTIQGYSPKQVWTYEQAKVKITLGQPKAEIVFIDQYGSDEWKLDRTPGTDVAGIVSRVNAAAITQPGLTVAPMYNAPAAAVPAVVATAMPSVPATPAAPSIGTFKTDSLRAAVDEMRAAKQSQYKDIYFSYGEFVTPKGDYFVPVQLFAPKVAGLAADKDYTFFGMVEDASGKPAAIFEEPAKLTASKDDVFFDKTMTLQPGKYKGTFGLAQNGKPVTMISSDLELAGVDKDAPGVSRLILSNNVYPLSEAQKPTDPYSFGGIKVVPKSDGTFTQSDELWYFFELRNPGLELPKQSPATATTTAAPAAAAAAPHLRAKLTVEGKVDGKTIKYDNPPMDVDAQPLKGVEGHYAVGQSIPLAGFKPGDYTMKIKVTDVVKNQVYEMQQNFKVVK
jgi:GWxTD domain-containing protein